MESNRDNMAPFLVNGRPSTTDDDFPEDVDPRAGCLEPDSLAKVVLQDIRLSMEAKRQRRRQCLFFHLVSGGNVKNVRAILQFLTDNDHTEELNWLLNKQEPDDLSIVSRCLRGVLQTVMVLLTLVVFLVTTPIFYMLHALSLGFHASSRVSISEDPRLPLVFALKSESPDMIQLFFSKGVTLGDTDTDSNNIYHYLSDLSSTAPDDAIRLHDLLMGCLKDVASFRTVILGAKNHEGLTPLELSCRWGSIKFTEHLVLEKGLMRETLVSVNDRSVWIDDKYLSKMNSRKYIMGIVKPALAKESTGPGAPKYHLEVAEYDLHRYERGDTLGQQSYLLQLIASRKVEEMTDEDIESFLRSDFLHSWVKRKRHRFTYPSVIAHIVQVLVTLLMLLYLLHFGGDMNPFPLLEKLVENYLKVSLDLLMEGLDESTSKSLNKTRTTGAMSEGPTTDYRKDWADGTSPFFKGDFEQLSLDDITLRCYNKTEIVGELVLNQCLAKALAMVMRSCEGLRLADALEYSGVKLFLKDTDFQTMDYNKIIALVLETFMLCHMFVDLVYRITFLARNLNMTRTFPYVTCWALARRRFPGSYIEKMLLMSMYCMFTGYLFVFWHLEQRLKSYLVTTFQANLRSTITGIQEEMNSVTVQATFTAEAFDAHEHVLITKDRLMEGLAQVEQSSFVTNELLPMLNGYLRIMSYLLITCLIMRFLLAIHVMRLLPGVGFFVITARKMAQHLVEFVMVFLLVAVAFATIFHFVMRDPDCPANKSEGFSGMADSLFSTYLIALGQGEFVFFENTNGQIAFVVYTVITVLLLFNLIIAVMSTTVDSLNRKTWRRAMCILETWDEILGVEATCQTLALPLDCCLCLGRHALARCTAQKPKTIGGDDNNVLTSTV